MKKLIVSGFLVLFPTITLAGPGETGFAFLKIGTGARAAALGDAAVTLSTDASATYWNPAGLAWSDHNSAVFSYNRWIEGVNHNFFAGSFRANSWSFGLQVIATGVDDIEQREIPSEDPTATFSSHDFAIGASIARKLDDRWSAGLTAKYIYERIQYSTSALAFDAGCWYKNTSGWQAGLTISNIGFSGKLNRKTITLPSSVSIGGSYPVLKREKNLVTAYGGLTKNFHGNSTAQTGAEYAFESRFFLRAGYLVGINSRSWSAGLGFAVTRVLKLDYAFTPFSNGLGNSHKISAGIEF